MFEQQHTAEKLSQRISQPPVFSAAVTRLALQLKAKIIRPEHVPSSDVQAVQECLLQMWLDRHGTRIGASETVPAASESGSVLPTGRL